jgi:AcrR family transcriptional regulator
MPAGEPPQGIRERKKQETRSALSWAVIRLSVERGWDNVSIEDVAALANVTGRTFRNYFSSKAEAVVARHLDRMLDVVDALRARPADEPLDQAITEAVRQQFRGDDNSHHDVRMRVSDWASGVRLMLSEPDVRGEMLKANAIGAAELATAIAERLDTDTSTDYYPALVASTTNAAITVALDHWLSSGGQMTVVRAGYRNPETLIVEVLGRLWAGLPTS